MLPVPEAAGRVTVAPEATFKFIVRPALLADVKVTLAVTDTRESEPEINPFVDVTGPEKVVEAILTPFAQGLALQSVQRQVGEYLSARLRLLRPK